jgi:exodeoxyribonuclease-5
MLKDHLTHIIREKLDHSPTQGQEALIVKLSEFITGLEDDDIFLIRGYAGTGKTSLIASIVKTLKEKRRRIILMAPTGRAAKVLSSYSGYPAMTIHKKIYRQKSIKDGFSEFSLDRNLHADTIFIVDEASMISNQSLDLAIFGSGRLLDDLVTYIYSGVGCKLILIGDSAQLPPVGLDNSEALDPKILGGYGFPVKQGELTEVVRQALSSGILLNATRIRERLDNNDYDYPGLSENEQDVVRLSGENLIESIEKSYDNPGIEDTIIVCRSNKQANRYNQGIRNSILWKEEELAVGDQLMIVRNNYYWLKDEEEVDFIANGDIAIVNRIHGYKELYGLRFADVNLRLVDYKNLYFDDKIVLDSLMVESAALDRDAMREFFLKVMDDYQHVKGKKNRTDAVREDPYFNALQVKFAYAVTCHKAQGGQWKHVYIDQGYINEDRMDREYYRWLYTAFTRATEKLFLVNFREEFFG